MYLAKVTSVLILMGENSLYSPPVSYFLNDDMLLCDMSSQLSVLSEKLKDNGNIPEVGENN